MKTEEYRTLCLMCWSLGLFLLGLGVFTATYQNVDTGFTLFGVDVELPIEDWHIRQPYRKWSELLYFAGGAFLFISIGLFKESCKMLEKK